MLDYPNPVPGPQTADFGRDKEFRRVLRVAEQSLHVVSDDQAGGPVSDQ
jgi:hypothetical protein